MRDKVFVRVTTEVRNAAKEAAKIRGQKLEGFVDEALKKAIAKANKARTE